MGKFHSRISVTGYIWLLIFNISFGFQLYHFKNEHNKDTNWHKRPKLKKIFSTCLFMRILTFAVSFSGLERLLIRTALVDSFSHPSISAFSLLTVLKVTSA